MKTPLLLLVLGCLFLPQPRADDSLSVPRLAGYVNLLTQHQRHDEARRVVQTAVDLAPEYNQFTDLLNRLNHMK